MLTWWFFSQDLRICQYTSFLCVNRSLGGTGANWHHSPSPHIGLCKNLPTSEGSSITRSTSVALRGSRGVSTIPLTNPPPKHCTIFLRASMKSQTTKQSRRWQPQRVTSTTGLQLDHLVPLDAITLESLTNSIGWTLSSKSDLEGSQAPPHKPKISHIMWSPHKYIILYVHCVDLLIWSPTKLDFSFYNFSAIYYNFLKIQPKQIKRQNWRYCSNRWLLYQSHGYCSNPPFQSRLGDNLTGFEKFRV
jgi:hypothetical protein